MANLSKTTQDHEEIKRWAEERGAEPACVKGTGDKGDIGLLRLDFPGYSGEQSLQHISWDEFFEKFDEQNLALIYQEETAEGERSNFNKLVSAETAAEAETHGRKAAKKKTAAKKAVKKAAAKKASAKKTAAKKTPLKKAPLKKAATKKAPAKKAAKKKTAAKKAPAKKSAATKKASKRRR